MKIGFYTVFRGDPQHYLHASALVRDAHEVMPCVPIIHLTDRSSPPVQDVTDVVRSDDGPILQRRLEAYASCEGPWLFVDTDVSIRQNVEGVLEEAFFDVAVTDRHWPHLAQGDPVMHTMPFNTGVVFSKNPNFWHETLKFWERYSDSQKADWLSEQRAVYETVRSGHYRVKILPGMCYNYPPSGPEDAPETAALLHYKGPHRKQWLTDRYYRSLREPA